MATTHSADWVLSIFAATSRKIESFSFFILEKMIIRFSRSCVFSLMAVMTVMNDFNLSSLRIDEGYF